MDVIVNGHKAFAATGSRALNPDEPAIILVHGAGLDRTVWQLQTRNIAFMGRQVYAVDMPGHGRSGGEALTAIEDMADWVGDFMDAAGIKTAKLIGHSMGSFVALEAAARFPNRVDALCLMGISDTMPVHPDLLAAAQRNERLAPELIIFWGLGEKAKIGGHPHPGLWVHNASQIIFENAKNGVLHNDLAACNAYQGALDAASKVECETLFVLGKDDMMTPAKKGKAVANAIKSATMNVIEKCGHMMIIERPHSVYAALKNFV
jgi:pimeloyl-ACP methyl ester carboxylesterase